MAMAVWNQSAFQNSSSTSRLCFSWSFSSRVAQNSSSAMSSGRLPGIMLSETPGGRLLAIPDSPLVHRCFPRGQNLLPGRAGRQAELPADSRARVDAELHAEDLELDAMVDREHPVGLDAFRSVD